LSDNEVENRVRKPIRSGLLNGVIVQI